MSNFLLKNKWFILIYLVLAIIIYWIAKITFNDDIEKYTQKQAKEFSIGFKAAIQKYQVISDNFYAEFMADTPMLDNFRKASEANIINRTILREKTHNALQPFMSRFKDNKVAWFNLYLPDNYSFLRLSEIDLYDYNAGYFLSWVPITNQTRKFVSGYETGPASPGYRFVYPIFYDSIYCGCLELGFSLSELSNGLKEIFPYEFRFLIPRDILISKTPAQFLSNYKLSDLSEDYLYEKTFLSSSINDSSSAGLEDAEIIEFNKLNKKNIKDLLAQGETFGQPGKVGKNQIFALFYPISSREINDHLIVISYNNDPTIGGFRQKFNIILLGGFLGSAVIIILIAFYLNERKQLKQKSRELQKAADELRELNQMKDKFFSVIAHDLRNPFHGLVGLSQVLVEEFDTMDKDKAKRFHELLYQSARQGYQLVLNLLEWTRSQTGKIVYNPEKLNLARMVEENIQSNKNIAQAKNIKIISHLEPNLWIMGDYNMIHTIIRNLLSNAIKFSYLGNEIIVKGEKKEDYIDLSFIDFGMGMDEETVKNLFKIDIAQSSTGTAGEEGTGLGLILCKEFINYHKGKILVESKKNKGTTFTVSLPALE